jgi:pimeloyl-ACP methyl ester carboxylesterase
MALGRRVLASNREVNVFYTGFKACDSYRNGLQAITQVTCPVLFVLGETDQMTPPKAAQDLIRLSVKSKVVYLPGGHQQMNETPEKMLAALLGFLKV